MSIEAYDLALPDLATGLDDCVHGEFMICAVKTCILRDCQRATTSYIGVHQGRECARGRRCRHKRVRALHDHWRASTNQVW
jgi:hypothetical protein